MCHADTGMSCPRGMQATHDVPLAFAVFSFTFASSCASAERLSENERCACCPEAPADGGRRSCCACACTPARCSVLTTSCCNHLRHMRAQDQVRAQPDVSARCTVQFLLCSRHDAPIRLHSSRKGASCHVCAVTGQCERGFKLKRADSSEEQDVPGGYLAAAGISG